MSSCSLRLTDIHFFWQPPCCGLLHSQINMMRGLILLLLTLWLLLVVAHHGEGRMIPYNTDNSEGAQTYGASGFEVPSHIAAAPEISVPRPQPVATCIWMCEDSDYVDQCECVPIPPQLDHLLWTEDTIDDSTSEALQIKSQLRMSLYLSCSDPAFKDLGV